MNLDDVLNKAEDYETETAPGATSSGSEEFLRVAIQDIKPDLTSWDDIIPVADRELAVMEKRAANEAAAAERKAKSRSNALTTQTATAESDFDAGQSSDKDKDKSKKVKAGAGKTKAQRSIELAEKDIRMLVRGIQKFGDIRYRYEKISKDSKLENKNRTIVQQAADELIKACRTAMDEKEHELKAKADAGEDTKKHKAVLISFRNTTSINAETTLGRHENLKILNDCRYLSSSCIATY